MMACISEVVSCCVYEMPKRLRQFVVDKDNTLFDNECADTSLLLLLLRRPMVGN